MEAKLRIFNHFKQARFAKFKKLLGNGNSLGINISYEIQIEPNGIAESFIGKDFIKNDNICLILGDNIFMEIVNFKY